MVRIHQDREFEPRPVHLAGFLLPLQFNLEPRLSLVRIIRIVMASISLSFHSRYQIIKR